MLRTVHFLIIAAQLVGCQVKDSGDSSRTSYSGTLHGGMMAIGGETTGWMLTQEGETGGLQLDVTHVRDTAARLDGQKVIVSGRITQRQHVERGPVNVLVVDTIIPAAR